MIALWRRHRARLLATTFWLAAGFALVMASLPKPPRLPGEPTDKVQHILAFMVLTLLARAAWPGASRVKTLAQLSLFGAAIELVQLIPALHRSSDWVDWAADSGAVIAVLALLRFGAALRGERQDARG